MLNFARGDAPPKAAFADYAAIEPVQNWRTLSSYDSLYAGLSWREMGNPVALRREATRRECSTTGPEVPRLFLAAPAGEVQYRHFASCAAHTDTPRLCEKGMVDVLAGECPCHPRECLELDSPSVASS